MEHHKRPEQGKFYPCPQSHFQIAYVDRYCRLPAPVPGHRKGPVGAGSAGRQHIHIPARHAQACPDDAQPCPAALQGALAGGRHRLNVNGPLPQRVSSRGDLPVREHPSGAEAPSGTKSSCIWAIWSASCSFLGLASGCLIGISPVCMRPACSCRLIRSDVSCPWHGRPVAEGIRSPLGYLEPPQASHRPQPSVPLSNW